MLLDFLDVYSSFLHTLWHYLTRDLNDTESRALAADDNASNISMVVKISFV